MSDTAGKNVEMASPSKEDDAKKRMKEAADGSPNGNGQSVAPEAQQPPSKKKKQEPPKKADTTLPADAPFSADELATTLSVISKLAAHATLFDSAACRDLRKSMEPLVKKQVAKRGTEVGGARKPKHGV